MLEDPESYFSAPTIQQFINEVPGIVAVSLMPAHPGSATVTIEGPCGPSGAITLQIGKLAAPMMSVLGLATLVLVLGLLGTFVLRAKAV